MYRKHKNSQTIIGHQNFTYEGVNNVVMRYYIIIFNHINNESL